MTGFKYMDRDSAQVIQTRSGAMAGMFLRHTARPHRTSADQDGRGESRRALGSAAEAFHFLHPPESLRAPQTREAEGLWNVLQVEGLGQ